VLFRKIVPASLSQQWKYYCRVLWIFHEGLIKRSEEEVKSGSQFIEKVDGMKIDTTAIAQFRKYSLADYGFEYEAYHIPYNKYLSDSGGKWNEGRNLSPITFLRACKPGDRVQLLTHPLWWGKMKKPVS